MPQTGEEKVVDQQYDYQVQMDYDGFKELFVAQNGRFMRKAGVLSAIICFLVAAGMLAVVSMGEPLGPDGVLYLVVILGAGVVSVKMAIDPSFTLFSRGEMVKHWFAAHGGTGFDRKEDARCRYEVIVGDEGFTERSAAGSFGIPWRGLRPKPYQGERGTYFTVDDGRNSSMAYNMIGVNYAFRKDDPMGVLFIPKEVSDANPGLVGLVGKRIEQARGR